MSDYAQLKEKHGIDTVTPVDDEPSGNVYGVNAALAAASIYWTPEHAKGTTIKGPGQLFGASVGNKDEAVIPDSFTPSPGVSALDAVAEYYKMPSGELVGLHMALAQGGWYTGKTDPRVASYSDAGFFNAWKNVVTVAARSGKSIAEVLAAGAAQGGGRPKGGPTRAPLLIRVSNPDDLATVADEVGQQVLGRALTEKQKQQFVKAFQSKEAGAQRTAYSRQVTGGTVTDTPNAQLEAQRFAREADPMGAGSKDYANAVDTIMGLFTGGGL